MTTVTAAGDLAEAAAGQNNDFAELYRRVKAAGLLKTRPDYYAWKIALNLALLGAGWTAFFLVGDSWWLLAVAVFLAFAFVQTGFIGHDAGHLQISRGRRNSELLGLIHGNLLLGFSYGWWVNHHNKHHSHPNHLEMDPDITRRRAIFSTEQDVSNAGRFRRFVIRYQGFVFFPLLLLEALSMRVVSFQSLRNRTVRRVGLEGALIVTHLVTYLTVVFLVASPLRAVAFIVVQQGLFGLYLGSVFATNHKGMPVRRDGTEWTWLQRQVLTARNVRSSRFTDMWFGGLNYQIEHHLFPTMPRVNLRRCRTLVFEYCHEQGLPYHEVSLVESYQEVVRHLYRVSAAHRAGRTFPAVEPAP
jgi:fatty acid desaturase